MNRVYRLIRSRTREMWIGVFAIAALVALGGTSHGIGPDTLPTGGSVAAGQANISQAGSAMTVTQHTDRMIANWDTFNIGKEASVAFKQPGSSSVALNRIHDQNPSRILGGLSANGQVYLVNPGGIYFGATAQVDVGGLVASSLDIRDEDFMAGRAVFENAGGTGAIDNHGLIRTADGGYVAFISSRVSNSGTVDSPAGTVVMASGDRVSLDFAGDGLVSFSVDKGTIDALVENSGLISSHSGMVVMSASAVAEVTRAVVNNTGVIEASGISEQGGRIVLDGGEFGETHAAGNLDASSDTDRGGSVVVMGEQVKVASGAHLNASGACSFAGGGNIVLEAGRTIVMNAAAGHAGNLTLNAGDDILIGENIHVGGAMTVTTGAEGDFLTGFKDLSTGSGVSITADGGFLAHIGGAAYLIGHINTSGTDIVFNGAVLPAGFEADGTVTLNTGNGGIHFNGTVDDPGLTADDYFSLLRDKGLDAASEGFTGVFSVENWERAPGDGTIDTSGAPDSISMISGDQGNGGDTDFTIAVPADSTVEFQWHYRTEDSGGPEWDPFGYLKGETFFMLSDNAGHDVQSNAETIHVAAGEIFGFRANTFDGMMGPSLTGISDFRVERHLSNGDRLSACKLVLDAGSGDVIFGSALGGDKAIDGLDVMTTGNIVIDGGAVTTAGEQVYRGNVLLGGASTVLNQKGGDVDFRIDPGRSFTNFSGGDASLKIKTTGSILMDAGSSILSPEGKLDTLLWADSDGVRGGALVLKPGASIMSNGGNITLSGGHDYTTGHGTGLAGSGDFSNGITLFNATLSSGGGDITLRGKGAAEPGLSSTGKLSAHGILAGSIAPDTDALIDSGAGKLLIVGLSGADVSRLSGGQPGESWTFHGVEIGGASGDNCPSAVRLASANPDSDAIRVIGDASGSVSDSVSPGLGAMGVRIARSASVESFLGGVIIEGTASQNENMDHGPQSGVQLDDTAKILAAGGVVITGKSNRSLPGDHYDVNLAGGTVGHEGGACSASRAGDIIINADTLNLGQETRLRGDGGLFLQPLTEGTTIGIAGGAGTLSLPGDYFNVNFSDDFENMVVGAGNAGEITVGGDLVWGGAAKLTLFTGDRVNVHGQMENTSGTHGGVFFDAGGGVFFDPAGGGVAVHNVHQLQWINTALNGNYTLGSDIDASGTGAWNDGAGFIPIGRLNGSPSGSFTGTFDGLGHTVSGLTVNSEGKDNVGLFGSTSGARISGTGLEGGSVTGGNRVGGLVGHAFDTLIEDSFSSAAVSGAIGVGGLVGHAAGLLEMRNCYYAGGQITGENHVGGLIGGIADSESSPYVDPLDSHDERLFIENSFYNAGATVVNGRENVITFGGLYDSQFADWSKGGRTPLDPEEYFGPADAEGYYLVSSPDNLDDLLGLIYTSDGLNLRLTADMNLREGWHLPYFNGVLDGAGHTVRGLNVDLPGSFAGLVGRLHGGEIRNISLVDARISGLDNVGALAGYAAHSLIAADGGFSTRVEGSVEGRRNAGGVVGEIYQSRIVASDDGTVSFAGSVTGAQNNAGGLAGGMSDSVVDAARGSIYTEAHVSGGENVGGLVGNVLDFSHIKNVYAAGDVSAGNRAGGLVGWFQGGTITDSYARGEVDAGGGSQAGGLVGVNAGDIESCYSTGKVSGAGATGGLVGENTGVVSGSFFDMDTSGRSDDDGRGTPLPTPEMRELSTFTGAGWSIDDEGGTGSAWRIYGGRTYPLLRSHLSRLEITPSDVDKISDGVPYFGGGGFTCLPPGCDAGKIHGLPVYGGDSQGATEAGIYTIKLSGLYSDQRGYDITCGYGRLVIKPAKQAAVKQTGEKSKAAIETVSSSMTAEQIGVNSTKEAARGARGTVDIPSLGPGSGSGNITAHRGRRLVETMAPGTAVLEGITFSSPVVIEAGPAGAALSFTGDDFFPATGGIVTLALFTQTAGGQLRFHGNYLLHDGEKRLSLSESTLPVSSSTLFFTPGVPEKSAPFTLAIERGISIRMKVEIHPGGILVIKAPGSSSGSFWDMDVKQAVLMAIQAARVDLGLDPGALSSALLLPGRPSAP